MTTFTYVATDVNGKKVKGTEMAEDSVELINEGKFGNVVTINGDKMGYTSLEEVIGAAKVGQQKHVDPNGELVKAAKAIGISFGDE